jgi:hypothetical protein
VRVLIALKLAIPSPRMDSKCSSLAFFPYFSFDTFRSDALVMRNSVTSAEREAIHSKSDTHHPSHTRTINKKSFVAASLSRSFSLARALSLCSVTRQECRPNLHSSSSLLPLNKPSSSAPSRSSVTVEKRNIIHSACKSARPRSAENF